MDASTLSIPLTTEPICFVTCHDNDTAVAQRPLHERTRRSHAPRAPSASSLRSPAATLRRRSAMKAADLPRGRWVRARRGTGRGAQPRGRASRPELTIIRRVAQSYRILSVDARHLDIAGLDRLLYLNKLRAPHRSDQRTGGGGQQERAGIRPRTSSLSFLVVFVAILSICLAVNLRLNSCFSTETLPNPNITLCARAARPSARVPLTAAVLRRQSNPSTAVGFVGNPGRA